MGEIDLNKEFTSQSELFDYLWDNMPHVSEISGKPLYPKGHDRWHYQFSHDLAKGAFPAYKYKAFNITLMLPNEHIFYQNFRDSDRQTPLFKMYRDKWLQLLEKKERLKQQYFADRKLVI